MRKFRVNPGGSGGAAVRGLSIGGAGASLREKEKEKREKRVTGAPKLIINRYA